MIDKDFSDIFALSVQDLAASKVSQELNSDCVPCGIHQGDSVGISAVGGGGGLTRIKDNAIVNSFPEVLDATKKLQNMVKYLNLILPIEKAMILFY